MLFYDKVWTYVKLCHKHLRETHSRLLAAFDKGSQYIIQQNHADKSLLLKVASAISGYASILLK